MIFDIVTLSCMQSWSVAHHGLLIIFLELASHFMHQFLVSYLGASLVKPGFDSLNDIIRVCQNEQAGHLFALAESLHNCLLFLTALFAQKVPLLQ